MKINSEKELLDIANKIKGKTILEILNGKNIDSGKGAVGIIIERESFGIQTNNEARPDFPHLGVELKVLPLKSNPKGELSVKERTKICSINYENLIKEKWNDSHAREKLNKILFIFYHHHPNNLLNSKIIDHYLFELENKEEPIIKADWLRTQKRVEDGFAHELSESENLILAASRSGEGGLAFENWPQQPNKKYQERARQRSFSLKPSYTNTIWYEIKNKKPLDSIFNIHRYNNYVEFENFLLSKLNSWQGKSLDEFAKFHNIKIGRGKNSTANILRHALGLEKGSGHFKEIMQLGINVKTIQYKSENFMPFEAISFPYQPLGEIAAEKRFDESEFYTYLQAFLFIPLNKENRNEKSLSNIFFGKSFIWRPSKLDLMNIQKEWEKNKSIIENELEVKKISRKNTKGYILTNNLLKESISNFIHMRPHAKDSNDLDPSMISLNISKQCFWLNKNLIRKLILNNL
jgi:DNA mismatch repair endonuclease MutH